MILNIDIFRVAHLLVKRHGEDAPIEAAMRADAMLDKGDLDGYAAWKRILRAVEELRRAVLGYRGVLRYPGSEPAPRTLPLPCLYPPATRIYIFFHDRIIPYRNPFQALPRAQASRHYYRAGPSCPGSRGSPCRSWPSRRGRQG